MDAVEDVLSSGVEVRLVLVALRRPRLTLLADRSHVLVRNIAKDAPRQQLDRLRDGRLPSARYLEMLQQHVQVRQIHLGKRLPRVVLQDGHTSILGLDVHSCLHTIRAAHGWNRDGVRTEPARGVTHHLLGDPHAAFSQYIHPFSAAEHVWPHAGHDGACGRRADDVAKLLGHWPAIAMPYQQARCEQQA